MDDSQNQLPVATTLSLRYKILLLVLIIALVISLYIIAAILLNFWPFERNAVAPTVETSATPDQTADWQTYHDERMGFEVKLPSQLLAEDTTFGTIRIKNRNAEEIMQINSHERSTTYEPQSTLEKDIEFSATTNYIGIDSGNVKNITLEKLVDDTAVVGYFSQWNIELGSGKTDIKIRADFEAKNQKPSIQDPKNQYRTVHSITLSNNDQLEIFKKVINTFRLLNASQLDTSGWKTYQNLEIDLNLKYPANWILEEQRNIAGPVITINSPDVKAFESDFTVVIDTRKFKNLDEISAFFQKLEQESKGSTHYQITNTDIDGNSALSILQINRNIAVNTTQIYLIYKNKIYNFLLNNQRVNSTTILKTVKFI